MKSKQRCNSYRNMWKLVYKYNRPVHVAHCFFSAITFLDSSNDHETLLTRWKYFGFDSDSSVAYSIYLLNKHTYLNFAVSRSCISTTFIFSYKWVFQFFLCDRRTKLVQSTVAEYHQCWQAVAQHSYAYQFVGKRRPRYATRFQWLPTKSNVTCFQTRVLECKLFSWWSRKSETRAKQCV